MMEELSEKERILIYGSGTTEEELEFVLRGNGYEVYRVGTSEKLCESLSGEELSLLLFTMSEKADRKSEELALLKKIRQGCKKPILVVLDGESDILRIMALNAGADDCIGSDCSFLECMARIKALFRCYQRLLAVKKKDRIIKLEGLEVDDGARMVRVEGKRVDLTPTEYKILRLLMEKPGRVMSNRQIYERIWEMMPIGTDNTVAVHIRHIREKIEENPQNPRYLKVVWGQGYKVG